MIITRLKYEKQTRLAIPNVGVHLCGKDCKKST